MGLYPNGQSQRGPNAAGILGWINALDEGCIGNGLPDDGLALKNLLAALPSTGQTVVMPPGTYLITTSVNVPAGQTLIICTGVTLTGAGAIASPSGGGLIIDWRSGGMVVTSGNSSSAATALALGGGAFAMGQSPSAVAVAASGTISTAGLAVSRVLPAAAVTLVVLQAGTLSGQICTVLNEAIAARSVTFDVAGTSNVADGVSSVIAGLNARTFVWDSGTSLWYPSK